MTDTSRRQLIVTAVVERLAEIAIEHGYQTDAGAAIYIGERPNLGPDDPSTAIALLMADDEPGYQGEQVFIQLPLEIHALARVGLTDAWMRIEAILADIKKAIERPDRTLGGLVKRQIQRDVTRTFERTSGEQALGIVITYRAPYTELWGTP